MSKKLTTKEFIERAIKTHGDTYDYSESDYKSAKDKVKIFCKVHGEFFDQLPTAHVYGQGCPKCGFIKSSKRQSKTREQFIADCIAMHGNSYDYTEIEYKNGRSKVIIKCNKHNSYFTQIAGDHLSGHGCPTCGYEKIGATSASNRDRFLEAAALVHGTKYTYDKTVYVGAIKNITITCSVHGDYITLPNSHLSGHGCPRCAKSGYNPSKPGHLYVLQCKDVTKIGITNRSPSIRARNVSKSYGAEFSVKYSWRFDNGSIPNEIETVLLRELRSDYSNPVNRFDGSSECFLNVDHTLLLTRINQEIALRTQ